jgi:PAS domain S-box-containing protein
MKEYLRYFYALLAVSLALLLRYALVPVIGPGLPYVTLFPVTVSVALLAGFGPAILTGIMGGFAVDYLFIQPLHTFIMDVGHLSRLVIVTLTSAFVGYVGDGLRTSRAKAEKQAQALRESEQRLERAQEIAHLGSWELDLVNSVLTWSDEVYRIFGLKPQEFGATYEAFLEAVHPDDRAAVDAAYSSSLREGKDTYEIEHRVLRKAAGEIRYVHEKCEHVRDETGRIIRSVGMVHDITERKRAEAALRESEERFRALAETASDAIVSADSAGNIIFWNAEAESIFGYSADEAIGRPLAMIMPERFREAHKKGMHRLLSTGEARVIGKAIELAGLRKDGSEFPLELSLSRWNTRQGLFFTGVVRDITERKRAEEKIKSLNEELKLYVLQLEAANRELEAFSYSVSHDLRSPLRSIAGFGQVLLEDYAEKLDEEGRDSLERMIAATRRMGQLIDDLLRLSRVTRAEMKREQVSLSEIVGRIAAGLRKARPERDVEFVIAEGLYAHGDERLLNLALENLLNNAWKFTEKHPRARIEFGVLSTDKGTVPDLRTKRLSAGQAGSEVVESGLPPSYEGKIVYFVRDDGAGFDMAYAGSLFNPFHRLHAVNEFPGTGIGLATVKRIINRHGGRVWIEGEVEKGTTVYFTL